MNSIKQKSISSSNKNVVRIAIYARYSSDMQNPDSANEQVDGIKYRLEKGLVDLIKYPRSQFQFELLSQWILKDEAETGKVADRASYEMILEGIRTKSFDALFVDDLSRLTRSLGDQIGLYELLKFHGIELYSIRDGLSSEASNAKMQFQVKGLVNDLGNEMHALRTKRGQEARVLKGYSTGDICYGYKSKPTRTRMSGGREVPSHYEISVNPEQARVIDLIFDLKIKGLGYSAIAKYLNDQKIPSTDRGRKITGKVCNWNSGLVRSILLREKYIGIWRWGKTTRMYNPDKRKIVKREAETKSWVEHNAGDNIREDLIIVSIEKWEKVQKLINETIKQYQKENNKVTVMHEAKKLGTKGYSLLAGILFCDECKSQMLLVAGQRGGYYGCYTHHRKSKNLCSNNRLLGRKKIEPQIINLLSGVLLSQENLKKLADITNSKIKAQLNDNPQDIKALEIRIQKLEREINNAMEFVFQGGGTSELQKKLESKEIELRASKERLKKLQTLSVDKLLLTPFAIKEEFQNLIKYCEKQPILANNVLRKFFKNGLYCRSKATTSKKNLNQNNSLWQVEGSLIVGDSSGLENLGVGGGGGNRTHVRTKVKAADYVCSQFKELTPGLVMSN